MFSGATNEFQEFLGTANLVPALSVVRVHLEAGSPVDLYNESLHAIPLRTLEGYTEELFAADAEVAAVEVFGGPTCRLEASYESTMLVLEASLRRRPLRIPASLFPVGLRFVAEVLDEAAILIEEWTVDHDTSARSGYFDQWLQLVGTKRLYDGYLFEVAEVLGVDDEQLSPPSAITGQALNPTAAASIPGDGAAIRAAIATSGGVQEGVAIRSALLSLLEEHGIEVASEGPEILGSWRQHFILRLKGAANSPAGREAIEKTRIALENAVVNHKQAEIDNLKADSASRLIAATESVDDAVIILGQILYIKHNGRIVTRSVDAVTASRIENSRVLLDDPASVLRLIAGHPPYTQGPNGASPETRTAIEETSHPPEA
ncbi:hypothetical protein [Blastococcus sp. TBT05-19]|uniref:hypothetical protein n=1 Tax=Blastococcus sp. TBT05-19 TaxID=2250581 RepID=UPI0011BED7BB|nr:hypothetical protein [Blastococcus sp. TBT05-19]